MLLLSILLTLNKFQSFFDVFSTVFEQLNVSWINIIAGRSGIFIVNFEHISQLFLVFQLLLWTSKCYLGGILKLAWLWTVPVVNMVEKNKYFRVWDSNITFLFLISINQCFLRIFSAFRDVMLPKLLQAIISFSEEINVFSFVFPICEILGISLLKIFLPVRKFQS